MRERREAVSSAEGAEEVSASSVGDGVGSAAANTAVAEDALASFSVSRSISVNSSGLLTSSFFSSSVGVGLSLNGAS